MLSTKGNASNSERNITALSTNDFGVAAVLDVLGVFNSMPVPFDSTIMMELRKLGENNLTITVRDLKLFQVIIEAIRSLQNNISEQHEYYPITRS